MIRKIRRNILKKEMGTNNINSEWHKRYGYKPNVSKGELKLLERIKKGLRKLAHKKSRIKKRGNNNE